ncbi:hypothetical protein CWB85_18205 [Pseudoalteromonas sp. S1727]|uniref:hypothetical protein n=1 Tax=Pseudoalteromonas sp. S1727 TaxID=2066514 RepID=UPI0011089AD4|nr:hypothetical protein [Pseudoalteromonas sp. S1727]TMN68751.1 hypothetical protein CWB85_18205 [Pseudoalteromonas sp. S1727]
MSCLSYFKCLVSTACLVIVSGCMSTTDSAPAESASLAQVNNNLNELVQDTSCTASFQCKVLEVGQRACGGPSRYVVYSTLNTEQEKAEQLAQQTNLLEADNNKTNGLTDCLPVLPVQALCIDKTCQSFELK